MARLYFFFVWLCAGFSEGIFQLQKYEELLSSVNKNAYPSMPQDTGETGDLATPPSYGIGQQAETQRKPRRCPPLQRAGTDGGIGLVFTLADCAIQLSLLVAVLAGEPLAGRGRGSCSD